jgi:hypothetical protein
MEGTAKSNPTTEPHRALACADAGRSSPFSRQWVTITKQEHIDLACRASYWEAQHARVKSRLEEARQDNLLKDAKIKDLRNRSMDETRRAALGRPYPYQALPALPTEPPPSTTAHESSLLWA